MKKVFTLIYPWDVNGYKPAVEYYLTVDQEGFHMHILAMESNPRREQTEHQSAVCTDSCVEWFVNFCPKESDRYFNFEVNPNGAMYASFRKNRYDYRMLELEEIEQLNIKVVVNSDIWEVHYTVPFTLIQKYIPEYQFKKGMMIKANFYKCGDDMIFPHYGMWSEIKGEQDFHTPEFFGEIVLK